MFGIKKEFVYSLTGVISYHNLSKWTKRVREDKVDNKQKTHPKSRKIVRMNDQTSGLTLDQRPLRGLIYYYIIKDLR